MKDSTKKKFEELKAIAGLKTPKELKAAAEHSMRGFLSVLFGEKAFRTDIVVFLVCVAVAFAIPGLSWCERALMIYAAFMPLVAELINTAIEKTIDRISTERHWLSGLAKDIGSALVSASFFGAGICWFVILLGYGIRLWKGGLPG
ncbi:MAG: diacylglycerol kinase [Kiritimatiellae bacterium]|nr:diacylglycerol kinase [Kiritimatiellia bacterium]